ncbi:MAG: tRNA uridine-5-carboxymethylaminomethyl(34) synthesis enzyme MnmG [Limnochordia bacterium]
MSERFDVIVVGAGHAGAEAALAAARLGMRTLALTLSLRGVASMPCNPSIGGPAKGQLVREIDALGGEMALNIDATCMQLRTLNTSKGPAVQTLRAQADRFAYSERMRRVLERQPRLELRQGTVSELLVERGRVLGVATKEGQRYFAPAVILTTGTYMNARVHIGEVNFESGPRGEKTTNRLSASLRDHGFELVRFKTGTPARVRRDSIAYEKLEPLAGDPDPEGFSFMTGKIRRPQALCWITYTNSRTHEIIHANMHRAAMYSGAITGPGPRYCPSIEAKLKMFPDKERHQVFIEPEGWDSEEMYLAGVSTSLPREVQDQFLRTIPGLENVEILRYGYAIEYDALVPTQIDASLMTKSVVGLFTAGQVNGTTGYEEAAAQGIVAGINAARFVRGEEPLILDRSQAYIGVLIDDLVTKGTNEPYRMLTSRAEYRLLLRHDNADKRLTPIGRQIGLVTDERYRVFEERWSAVEAVRERLGASRVGCTEAVQEVLRRLGTQPLRPGQALTLAELLKRPEITWAKLVEVDPGLADVDEAISRQVEIEVKYEGYIAKQEEQVERFRRLEAKAIPDGLDYFAIPGLSREACEKLSMIRPRSIGQAARISGVSPADISVLLVYLHARGGRPQAKAVATRG